MMPARLLALVSSLLPSPSLVPAVPLAAAWPVWAGLAALAAAAALALGPIPRWQAQAEIRLAEIQRLAQAPAAEPERAAPVLLPQAAPLPDRSDSPRRAHALSVLAVRRGLTVLQTREQLDAAGHLQLAQSGQAGYPALRSFVERALAADPALALDRLRLQRSDPAGAEVAFELQWTLLHQAPAARSRTTPAAPARPTP